MPRTVTATALIAAPLDVVWRTMIDLPSYGAWNPFVVALEAPRGMAVGGALRLTAALPGRGRSVTTQRILSVEPPAHGEATLIYRLSGALSVLVSAQRSQALRATAEGCRYTSHETFGGLFARFIPLDAVRRGTETHAAALKAEAERRAR